MEQPQRAPKKMHELEQRELALMIAALQAAALALDAARFAVGYYANALDGAEGDAARREDRLPVADSK